MSLTTGKIEFSHFADNLDSIIEQLTSSSDRTYIVVQGETELFVLQSFRLFNSVQERMALLQLLLQGQRELDLGKTESEECVANQLANNN